MKKALKEDNMVFIDDGTFMMGSDKFYPEEKPAHKVSVTGFWIDKYLVTNKAFSDFVSATNYVTVAERPLNLEQDLLSEWQEIQPDSMVFRLL